MLPRAHQFQLRRYPHFFETAQKTFFRYGVVFYRVKKSGVMAESKNSIQSQTRLLAPVPDSEPLLVSAPLSIQAAFIVPKKRFAKATERHRISRRLSAALAQAISEIQSAKGSRDIKSAQNIKVAQNIKSTQDTKGAQNTKATFPATSPSASTHLPPLPDSPVRLELVFYITKTIKPQEPFSELVNQFSKTLKYLQKNSAV